MSRGRSAVDHFQSYFMDAVASDDDVAKNSPPSADVDANARAATKSPGAGQPREAAPDCAGTAAGHTQRHAYYTLVGPHAWPSPGSIADRMHACMPLDVMHVAHALALQHAACTWEVQTYCASLLLQMKSATGVLSAAPRSFGMCAPVLLTAMLGCTSRAQSHVTTTCR